jgi:hypothetical protein
MALIGWIAAELVIFQRYNVLQPLILGLGIAMQALAAWAHRNQPLLPLSATFAHGADCGPSS